MNYALSNKAYHRKNRNEKGRQQGLPSGGDIMKRMRLIVIIFLLCAILSSCNNRKHPTDIIQITNDQNSFQYVTSTVDYEQLRKALNNNPGILKLNEIIPLDFMKTTNTGYSTIFETEKGFVYVVFDTQQDFLFAKKIQISKDISEAEMDRIPAGTALMDIRNMDAIGDYSFLYTGSSNAPAISHHYLENGLHYAIYYDENFNVLRIEKDVV